MFLKNRAYENILVNKKVPIAKNMTIGTKGDVMKEAQVCLPVEYVVGGHPTILRHSQLSQILHHLNCQHLFLESNVLLR